MDQPFQEYLKQLIENQHDDGSNLVTAQALMIKASNFYNNKVQCSEWEQPTVQEDEQILALAAEVKSLKKVGGGKGKQGAAGKRSFRKNKRLGHNNQPNNPGTTGAPRNPAQQKPEWIVKSIAPSAANINKPHMWNGAKWFWCHKDTGGKCSTGMWRTHHPKKCEGRMNTASAAAVGGNQHMASGKAIKFAQGMKTGGPGLKLVCATQSILHNRMAEQAMEVNEVVDEDAYMTQDE
jgi:hypothetical protein